MSDKMTIVAPVTRGRLPDNVSCRIRGTLLALDGKMARITIERQKKRRSLNQNKFYWGIVIPCVIEVLEKYGNIAGEEMAHDVCKENFLPASGRKKVFMKGIPICESLTSTELNTVEWEDYITKIRAWCAEEGVIVPLPKEVYY